MPRRRSAARLNWPVSGRKPAPFSFGPSADQFLSFFLGASFPLLPMSLGGFGSLPMMTVYLMRRSLSFALSAGITGLAGILKLVDVTVRVTNETDVVTVLNR